MAWRNSTGIRTGKWLHLGCHQNWWLILLDMKWFLHHFQPGELLRFWIFLCPVGFPGKLAIQIFLDGLVIFIPHRFFVLHFKYILHSPDTENAILGRICSFKRWGFYQNSAQKYRLKLIFFQRMFVTATELAKKVNTVYIVFFNSWHPRCWVYIISWLILIIFWKRPSNQLKLKVENHTENRTSKIQTPWNSPTENRRQFRQLNRIIINCLKNDEAQTVQR